MGYLALWVSSLRVHWVMGLGNFPGWEPSEKTEGCWLPVPPNRRVSNRNAACNVRVTGGVGVRVRAPERERGRGRGFKQLCLWGFPRQFPFKYRVIYSYIQVYTVTYIDITARKARGVRSVQRDPASRHCCTSHTRLATVVGGFSVCRPVEHVAVL